jgi:hypothetical protein
LLKWSRDESGTPRSLCCSTDFDAGLLDRSGARRGVLHPGVVDSHLPDDEFVCFEDGFLRRGVQLIPGSEGGRLLNRCSVELSVAVDHGGHEDLNRFLAGLDFDLADSISDVFAGVEMFGVAHAPACLVSAAGRSGLVASEQGQGIDSADFEIRIVAAEPVVCCDIGNIDFDVVVGGKEEGRAPLLGLIVDGDGLAEWTSLNDLLRKT